MARVKDGETHRVCSQCTQSFPIIDFNRDGYGGRKAYCYRCAKNFQQTWYQRKGYTHLKRYNILHNYGITEEAFNALLIAQDGRCKICCTILDGLKNTHIDHIHGTKIIRGILCQNCNIGIGQFKDSMHLLFKAAHYLNTSILELNANLP